MGYADVTMQSSSTRYQSPHDCLLLFHWSRREEDYARENSQKSKIINYSCLAVARQFATTDKFTTDQQKNNKSKLTISYRERREKETSNNHTEEQREERERRGRMLTKEETNN